MAQHLPAVAPDAETIRTAWDDAERAEAAAEKLREHSDAVLFDAYKRGWKVAELADVLGVSGAAGERRLYRRLRRPFERAAG